MTTTGGSPTRSSTVAGSSKRRRHGSTSCCPAGTDDSASRTRRCRRSSLCRSRRSCRPPWRRSSHRASREAHRPGSSITRFAASACRVRTRSPARPSPRSARPSSSRASTGARGTRRTQARCSFSPRRSTSPRAAALPCWSVRCAGSRHSRASRSRRRFRLSPISPRSVRGPATRARLRWSSPAAFPSPPSTWDTTFSAGARRSTTDMRDLPRATCSSTTGSSRRSICPDSSTRSSSSHPTSSGERRSSCVHGSSA